MTHRPGKWWNDHPEIASHDIVTRAMRVGGSPTIELGDRAEPLEVLCRSLDRDAALTRSGRRAARKLLIELVSSGSSDSPPSSGSTTDRPLVAIVGLDGSGARKLAAALSPDPEAADRGFAESLLSLRFERKWHVPSFAEWLAGCDPTHTVTELLGRLRPKGDPSRSALPYTVISSQQLIELPRALLSIRPDALIVHVHREPADCAPTIVGECVTERGHSSGAVDPNKIGRYWAWRLETLVDRNLEQRATTPMIEDRIRDIGAGELKDDGLQRVASKILTELGIDAQHHVMPNDASGRADAAGRSENPTEPRSGEEWSTRFSSYRERFSPLWSNPD